MLAGARPSAEQTRIALQHPVPGLLAVGGHQIATGRALALERHEEGVDVTLSRPASSGSSRLAVRGSRIAEDGDLALAIAAHGLDRASVERQLVDLTSGLLPRRSDWVRRPAAALRCAILGPGEVAHGLRVEQAAEDEEARVGGRHVGHVAVHPDLVEAVDLGACHLGELGAGMGLAQRRQQAGFIGRRERRQRRRPAADRAQRVAGKTCGRQGAAQGSVVAIIGGLQVAGFGAGAAR